MECIFKVLKEKKSEELSPKNLLSNKTIFKNGGEMNPFPDKETERIWFYLT